LRSDFVNEASVHSSNQISCCLCKTSSHLLLLVCLQHATFVSVTRTVSFLPVIVRIHLWEKNGYSVTKKIVVRCINRLGLSWRPWRPLRPEFLHITHIGQSEKPKKKLFSPSPCNFPHMYMAISYVNVGSHSVQLRLSGVEVLRVYVQCAMIPPGGVA
jgi:hypothetical protein